METKINTAKPELNKLVSFCQAIYRCFTRAADALFELLDALLCSPSQVKNRKREFDHDPTVTDHEDIKSGKTH